MELLSVACMQVYLHRFVDLPFVSTSRRQSIDRPSSRDDLPGGSARLNSVTFEVQTEKMHTRYTTFTVSKSPAHKVRSVSTRERFEYIDLNRHEANT
jgi:hypothetical protein